MLRRALAPAAVLLLATACSGRANDLDTYYDDPAEPTTSQVALPAPVTQAPVTTGPVTTDATTTVPPTADPSAAVLTADDLAEEGVQAAAGSPDPVAGCTPDASGNWRYPSGSEITQAVSLVPDAAARVAAMREEGACLPDSTTEGPRVADLGEDRHSWCYAAADAMGCAVAVADGDLLTVITVEAGSTRRASEAVGRIAPLAAAALNRGLEP
ncbi:hypothetical protein ACFPM7_22340 [Actinokineospora guangxiensis]|uniref:DUF3558 domain-containing protein n=1 Tax=Actinokineospora guangxiensis TaxID=1490288 RepID=A0ABW0EQW1_9PSEU